MTLEGSAEACAALLTASGPPVLLTGAGISTDSGIPDYRGPDGRQRRGAPISYHEFRRKPSARRRYWARSTLGWPHVAAAQPNDGHRVLAALQRAGLFGPIITQNVDKLHQSAGSSRVIDLHGSLAEAICLNCGTIESRVAVQRRILAANPAWKAACGAVAPDGDVQLDATRERTFQVPACGRCGGVLKPNVVLFGENVPRSRVNRAFRLFDSAGSLLVLGSSLTVFSGYRFVLHAQNLGIPVVIVNDGKTRGDKHSTLKVSARLGQLLPALHARLYTRRVEPAVLPY